MNLPSLLSDSESTQKIYQNQKKKLNSKNVIFFKTSRNVVPPSRPVDGVKKPSSLLGKPVDLASLPTTITTLVWPTGDLVILVYNAVSAHHFTTISNVQRYHTT